MSDLLLWQLAYHLAGPTLLSVTEDEPLGTLPIPVRTAVLKSIMQLEGKAIECDFLQENLQFATGTYEWVDNWRYKENPEFRSNSVVFELLLERFPQRYPMYQKIVFAILRQVVHKGVTHLKIADYQPTVAALAIAVLDSVALIENVARLYGLSVNLPQIDFYLLGELNEYGAINLLRNYRGVELDATTESRVKFIASSNLPDDIEFVSVSELLNRLDKNIPENSYTFKQLENLTCFFISEIGETPPQSAQPVKNVERNILDYFARRYFSVPELKQEQFELIKKALNNESVLGLLPTGYGKSLVFQLYALLITRTTLVISPLRALIHDQIYNLKRLGLNCVEFILTGDSILQRKAKLSDFSDGRYRILYIAPERLQTTEFWEFLATENQKTVLGALVIDEVHCVSELGHDFRPAYLQIAKLQQFLADNQNIPIIALTATVSQAVIKDIMRVLKLSAENIVKLASYDRPELSISVHTVETPEDKPALLARLIQEVIPQVLKMKFTDLIPYNQNHPYKNAGVIFGLYADSQGKRTFVEGVHNIAYEIQARLALDSSLVQVHASRAPECCPKCGSPVIQNETRKIQNKKQEVCHCLSCGAVFLPSERKKFANWDKIIQQRQNDFHNNYFPLLVATKGYSMGIEKRNIRFIVHHSLSHSLEAYYQEAGRAGRDRQHAHVALIFHPPHPQCEEDYINKGVGIHPPCVASKQNFDFWLCPYYEKHLCDYGHQARMIRKQYPGLEEDINTVLDTYKKLSSQETFTANGEKKNQQTQIALYRLQQLGIVQDFSLRYITITKIEYQVCFNRQWRLAEVSACLISVLIECDFDEQYARTQVNKILAPFDKQNLEYARELVLRQILHILLGRIYEISLRMRYQMLLNQLDYAKNFHSDTCRRIILKGIFTGATQYHNGLGESEQPTLIQLDDWGEVAKPSELISIPLNTLKPEQPTLLQEQQPTLLQIEPGLATDNYRCEFCDICNPKFEFTQQKAANFTNGILDNSLHNQFTLVFEEFNAPLLQEVLNFIIESQTIKAMFARVTNRLEREPTNLSALFLAGVIALRYPERDNLAFDYLKFGFIEGKKQGLLPSNLLLFYQQAAQLNPEEAFNWLTEVGGDWDSREGLKFLIQEAANRFGKNSRNYKVLTMLWQIRHLNQVNDDCNHIKPAIAILKFGF